MKSLVKKLQTEGALKTPEIIQSFLANDRKNFVPPEHRKEAYVDAPLSIGAGQTISQPYTVAFMMELLQPRQGQKILDVGFGSGWTTAILANVAGGEGKVFGLEVVPEVYEFGKANLQKMGYNNIELKTVSGWEGLSREAPFDRILVSASADKVPEELTLELAPGGRMVIPVRDSVVLVEKNLEGEVKEKSFYGFAFVPLVR